MISSVSETAYSQSGQGATASSSTGIMGKQDFLNLLVTQLKYQDPLNPTDSTEFTAQLAQFSSLEQLENVNSTLASMSGSLNDSIGGIYNLQAKSYIGSTVDVLGNVIGVSGENVDDIHYILDQDATEVYANIFDGSGEVVKTIQGGDTAEGEGVISWDGTDENGNQVDDGYYSFEVFAYDGDDGTVDLTAYTQNEITGIAYYDGEAYLTSGDLNIATEAVFRVNESQ